MRLGQALLQSGSKPSALDCSDGSSDAQCAAAEERGCPIAVQSPCAREGRQEVSRQRSQRSRSAWRRQCRRAVLSPDRSRRSGQNRSAAACVAYSAITCSSTVLPKPFRAGGVTGGPSRSCQWKVNSPAPSGVIHRPADDDPPARRGQRAVLGGVGGKLVQRERKALRGLGVHDQRGPAHGHAVAEGAHLAARQLQEIGALPLPLDQQDVRLAERMQAVEHGRLRLLDRAPCPRSCGRRRPAPPRTGSWCGDAARA